MKILKRVGLLVVIYPFVFLAIFAPVYMFDFSSPISYSDALEIISSEKNKLNIDSGVRVVLVLSDEKRYDTGWKDPSGPFTVTVYKNNIQKNTIQHEMFHIKRVLKTKAKHPSFLRYVYLEEPFAIMYERLNIKLLVE